MQPSWKRREEASFAASLAIAKLKLARRTFGWTVGRGHLRAPGARQHSLNRRPPFRRWNIPLNDLDSQICKFRAQLAPQRNLRHQKFYHFHDERMPANRL